MNYERLGLPNEYTGLARAVLNNIEPLVGTDAMRSGKAIKVAEQTVVEFNKYRKPDQLWRRKRASNIG